MQNQRRWVLLFAMLFLGLAAKVITPEECIRTANAQTLRIDNSVKLEITEGFETESVWEAAYSKLMYETPISDDTVAAFALAEVKQRDLELMSSSTDRIVSYHGRRFAITDEDYQILLKIVEAEATGEDLKGKLLVANVVLNRLEQNFGGATSIVEVVFAEGQFSPVKDGRLFKVTPSETTYEAVEMAMNGVDKSKGALYFMARELASKKGIRYFDNELKFLFKHGCHEFYTEKD